MVSIDNKSVTNNNMISGNNIEDIDKKLGENTQNKRIDVSNIKTD